MLLTVFVLALIAAPAMASCPAQGIPSGVITTRSISRPEGERQYRVYVPKNYTNQTPKPLVFSFHGLNDNCDNFITALGFMAYADSMGFILVAPCGSFGLLGIGWNAGTCCGQTSDDISLTRNITSDIEANLCIDPAHRYTTGFSNGAMMSEVLACVASDIFRAAVSVSGVVEIKPGNAAGLAACDSAYAAAGNDVAVLNVHGTLDFLVPWTGDELLGFPDIPTDMADWGKRAGCTSGPTQTFSKGTFSNQIWSGCRGNRTIELVKNVDGGHTWPKNKDFDTTAYAIDFMFNKNK